jgi:hypothetical protein
MHRAVYGRRPVYVGAKDLQNEQEVADTVAAKLDLRHYKIGFGKLGCLDRAFCDDWRIVFLAEIKVRSVVFGHLFQGSGGEGLSISEQKIIDARTIGSKMAVPVKLIYRFGCGTIAMLDVMTWYDLHLWFGRRDRFDARDIEVGAQFAWSDFEVLTNGWE